jgi:arylsulfatase
LLKNEVNQEQNLVLPWRKLFGKTFYLFKIDNKNKVHLFVYLQYKQFCPTEIKEMTEKKPNILVIFGDDIGISNLICYSNGLMGYRTPNIDRVANEDIRFTDSYGEQSCTADRLSFITGQSPFRTGLTKVGMPGAKFGIKAEDPTIAELLKPLGYATGHFGKNHLGDLDEHLPTNHGFDEFFGNLYHLNAEEEPENRDYPPEKDFPNFRKNYGPRDVIHSYADGRIEDTGPLTKKRMETIDMEFMGKAIDFIKCQHEGAKPFFVWFNTTRMHLRSHIPDRIKGLSGRWQSEYHDAMMEHDQHIGMLLNLLDELDIAEDTIVIYSTDNGPHMNSWPDGGMTPFRNEKNSCWEGAFRIPEVMRWPGKIPAGTISNEMVSLLDGYLLCLQQQESRILRKNLKTVTKQVTRLSRCILMDTIFFHIYSGKRKSPHVLSFFTFPMMEILSLCGMITGSLSLWSSAPEVHYWFGLNLLSIYAYQKYLICAPIPMNEQIRPPIPIMTGCLIMPSCWCQPRPS